MAIASNNEFPKLIGIEQGAAPSTPPAGRRKLYPKADGWYDLDDAGVETGPLGAGSGSSSTTITANTQTDNYTLVLADAGKVVEMNKATAVTLTVPPNSSVAFPIGTVIEVYAMGAGAVSVAAGAGVTIRNAGDLSAQYATASLRKRATDEWVLTGSLA